MYRKMENSNFPQTTTLVGPGQVKCAMVSSGNLGATINGIISSFFLT